MGKSKGPRKTNSKTSKKICHVPGTGELSLLAAVLEVDLNTLETVKKFSVNSLSARISGEVNHLRVV
jgi:hypothetical protein